ncbi:argininosuccinate lyase [Caldanaerobius fijiensis DSM 17918]|uniref:Argininosuccinate lyase n=1 Tax=Caldanaerobius fijiensis DSM 17918 TaxID=1121256 RepID=A0A1M5A5A0_9THEO|nr:argininosuccinate lyase [Caldanaerobius fijiensis]SHF25493.1 argininosuccinate lyase [Caldanaerobius fijiensis DSM 17918]
MKLWGGRFEKDTDKLLEEFNASIDVDARMYEQDIKGSIAHAMTLHKAGILSDDELKEIVDGLNGILNDIKEGKVEFTKENEDIHMNIEALLTSRIGEAGKKLHTARSRNDQVALDLRLYMRDEIKGIIELLKSMVNTLLDIAEDNVDTLMPGYTHLQRAQPITLAHHMLAYCSMFLRDIGRLEDCVKRMNFSPLGSGALAGTTYNLDREYTAQLLGFDGVTPNSLDAVSDRDHGIEFLSAAAIIMMHLSRFCEELVLWNSKEFSFIEMDDSFATGSSMMPQKKNPDAAELIRGKTGRVYGDLIALLTLMKGLPLAYNKDMQEDKEAIFDGIDTLKACIRVFDGMMKTIKFNKDNMRNSAKYGYMNATDMADYLVKKGMPFRKAHEVVGKVVKKALDDRCALEDLSIDTLRSFSDLFEDDIYEVLDLYKCVQSRSVIGGPAKEMVHMTINEFRKALT